MYFKYNDRIFKLPQLKISSFLKGKDSKVNENTPFVININMNILAKENFWALSITVLSPLISFPPCLLSCPFSFPSLSFPTSFLPAFLSLFPIFLYFLIYLGNRHPQMQKKNLQIISIHLKYSMLCCPSQTDIWREHEPCHRLEF